MQTITVKVLGPTATKPTRMKARNSGGTDSVTVSRDRWETIEEAADGAALELARKIGWTGEMICGGTNDGWVYVFTTDRRISLS